MPTNDPSVAVTEEGRGEERSIALAGLLCAVLELPVDTPLFATPSFGKWVPGSTGALWPPSPGSSDALWLIDTRDREGRAFLRTLAGGFNELPVRAALILTGSGPHKSWIRTLARRVRRPGTARWSERRLKRILGDRIDAGMSLRLGFDDGGGVPTSFTFSSEASSGAAYLWSPTTPFDSPLWDFMRVRLGAEAIRLSELHLRDRGAAVVIVESELGNRVVRVVPDGPLQDVVGANHEALLGLRKQLQAHDELLALIPRPLFHAAHGTTLVLAETRLAGTLAWKVFGSGVVGTIHRQAVDFLHAFRDATSTPIAREALLELMRPDRERLAGADFVAPELRRLLERELDGVVPGLSGEPPRAYASHGDYGPGNILVKPETGTITGIIDWDTFRSYDLPGIDRVNLEIQWRRSSGDPGFAEAVAGTWSDRAAHDDLEGPWGRAGARALFGAGVARYIVRSLNYPDVFRAEEEGFLAALRWMSKELRPGPLEHP